MLMKNNSLLTLDRLRLALSRNETAKRRSAVMEDSVDVAYSAVIRRDFLSNR